MIESTLARLQGWRVGSEEDANDEHLRAVRARGVFLLCTATATALPAIAPAQQIAVGGYAVPTVNNYNPASYGVEGITAGPDGALWYTELRARKSAGSPPPGRSPSTPCPPRKVAADPRGSQWGRMVRYGLANLTLLGASLPSVRSPSSRCPHPMAVPRRLPVGRMARCGSLKRTTTASMAGAVSSYPVPFYIPQPLNDGITVGPDGEFWYTLWEDNQIGEAFFVTASLNVSPVEGFYKSNLTFTGSGFAQIGRASCRESV